MGNWTLVIHGTGPHHNRNKSDADQMATKFIKELHAHHKIEHVSFTHGGRDYPRPPADPILRSHTGQTAIRNRSMTVEEIKAALGIDAEYQLFFYTNTDPHHRKVEGVYPAVTDDMTFIGIPPATF